MTFTVEEKLIINYLQAFAGQRVGPLRMVRKLADIRVNYSKGRLPVKKSIREAAKKALLSALSRLMKLRVVIRHREPQVMKCKRKVLIRLHASFEKKSVL